MKFRGRPKTIVPVAQLATVFNIIFLRLFEEMGSARCVAWRVVTRRGAVLPRRGPRSAPNEKER